MSDVVIKPLVPDPAGRNATELDALTVLAMLVWGEARGTATQAGKVAVAWCVRNRVFADQPTWFGRGWLGVMLKKWQFSAFNVNDPNATKMRRPLQNGAAAVWVRCYEAAAGVFFATVPDPTGGADHYHVSGMALPNWAEGQTPTAKIDGHTFYRLRK
jgi:N-acetylmuramoyl-L-alanine amidase